jgi:hypothetical protein
MRHEHKYVATEWMKPGYAGRMDCVCCGFAMLGKNNALAVYKRDDRPHAFVCDGCWRAIRNTPAPSDEGAAICGSVPSLGIPNPGNEGRSDG